MDLEEEPDAPPAGQTPERMRDVDTAIENDAASLAIHGIVMGEMENNYLMRGTRIDVLQNVRLGREGHT